MSLFDFNPFRASEELTPSQLRQDKQIAWARVFLSTIKYLSRRFKMFCDGVDYADYDSGTAYAKYDKVVWHDNGVYELRVTSSTGVPPTGNTLSATNWRKILDDFIGVDERVRYNGQLIVFEYALNRRFRISAAPYIYCTEITHGAAQLFVTINVPIAVYTALGPNNTARSARIVEFAEKYTLGGFGITITTY